MKGSINLDTNISLIEVKQNTSDIYIPLQAWFEGRNFLSQRFSGPNGSDNPSSDWGTWLSIQECCPLHQVNNLNWVGLHEARKNTDSFLEKVKNEFNGKLPIFIHGKERMIIEKKSVFLPNPHYQSI